MRPSRIESRRSSTPRARTLAPSSIPEPSRVEDGEFASARSASEPRTSGYGDRSSSSTCSRTGCARSPRASSQREPLVAQVLLGPSASSSSCDRAGTPRPPWRGLSAAAGRTPGPGSASLRSGRPRRRRRASPARRRCGGAWGRCSSRRRRSCSVEVSASTACAPSRDARSRIGERRASAMLERRWSPLAALGPGRRRSRARRALAPAGSARSTCESSARPRNAGFALARLARVARSSPRAWGSRIFGSSGSVTSTRHETRR